MRRARRAHADHSVWRQLEDGYVWVFGIVVVGAMAGNGVRELHLDPVECTSRACVEVSSALPVALLLLLVATALRLLLAVGPVVASRASGHWLLATPVDRGALLRPAYRTVLLWTVAVALAASLLAVAVPGLWGLGTLPVGMAGLTLLMVAVACVAVVGQASERRTRWMLRVADLLLVLAAIRLALLVRSARAEPEVDTLTILMIRDASVFEDPYLIGTLTTGDVFIALLAVAVAVLLAVLAAQSLGRLGTARVVAAGELAAGLAGAAASLDVGLLADIVSARRWRSVGRVRSRPGRWFGPAAIVQRELTRVLRWPRRLVFGVALLLIPYVVAAATESTGLVLLATTAAGLLATRPLTAGLRAVSRAPGLARNLPLSPRGLRITYAVVPGVFAGLWSFGAWPALPGGSGPAVAGVVALAVLAGVVRHATAPPPSYDGPLLATPMGAVPPGLMSQPLRGVDVAVIALLPALFGLSAGLALLVAAAVTALVLWVRAGGT